MIAMGFVKAGANVLISSRTENDCKEAVKSLQNFAVHKDTVQYVTGNVSSREGCKILAEYTKKVFNGRLDVLVNNAGTSWGEDPYDRESGRANWGWDRVLDLNVKGMFYLSRECVPLLERKDENFAEDPGRIINIGSIAGIVSQEAPTHAYDVSKAAVHHLTKKMAADLAKRNITVNAIAPGYVPSRMSKGLSAWGASDEKICKTIPLGRMGSEDDLAGPSIFLASRAGAWTTGVILVVDGGACTIQMPLSSL